MKMAKTKQNKEQKGKATIVITPDCVNEYKTGIYNGKEGPVIIYSDDEGRDNIYISRYTEDWDDNAEFRLNRTLHSIYGNTDLENVNQVYLYMGADSMIGCLNAAKSLSGNGKKLTIVACDCEAYSAGEIAKKLGAPIIRSECHGRKTLQGIVEKSIDIVGQLMA
jgi:hypothetical protein